MCPFTPPKGTDSDPLVIAGGPCASNPEPVADFFDAIVIGDGENVILEMADIRIQMESEGGLDKRDLLKKWSQLEGVYVPSVFQVVFNEKGHQLTRPLKADDGPDRPGAGSSGPLSVISIKHCSRTGLLFLTASRFMTVYGWRFQGGVLGAADSARPG